MSDQDVFNKKEEDTKTPSLEDKLKAITNEDGTPKYDSVEKAIEALSHSQNYIKQLEVERAKDRELADSFKAQQTRLEELENTFKNLQERKEEAPNTKAAEPADLEAKIADLVSRSLADRQEAEAKAQNVKTVSDALTEKFGDKVTEVVNAKAQEYGVTVDRLREMAADTPNIVLSIFNTTSKTNPTTLNVDSSVRVPLNSEAQLELPKFEKSLMYGPRTNEVVDAFKLVKDYTNKRLGVEAD